MKSNLKIPEKDKKIISKIIKKIKKAKTAFITWHARPDGDAIGGGLALYRILNSRGLDIDLISPTDTPPVYEFLDDVKKIKTELPVNKKDIGFILDCSDKNRLENLKEIVQHADTIINIDHHQLNQNFGDIDYVRPDSSSICELIFNMALGINYDFEKMTSLYIYIGIFTDTNKFQEQNTTPRAHKISAEFIEHFISPVEVASWIYGNQDLENLHLISKAIESLNLSPTNRVGYIIITPQMQEEIGSDDKYMEGIINYARDIKGVEVGLLFRKIDGLDGIKVSFRSKGKIDVGKIAKKFGGGGHHNAAGCLIKGDFKEVTEKVIEEVENYIKLIPSIKV
ncbi:MAG: DHH family phosphoesterase [Elusimicrobiota bacterium]